jgi:hypothetical protein
MARYLVQIPVMDIVEVFVEAEDEGGAIDAGLRKFWEMEKACPDWLGLTTDHNGIDVWEEPE